MKPNNGDKWRAALRSEKPLQIAGVINAYCAIMAESAGFKALYLSGAGVANASYGIPDVGVTTLSQVFIDAERVIAATALPVLVDADTGLGDIINTVQTLERLGAAGLHIEDQNDDKRCGQLDGKKLVTTDEMCARIKKACSARKSKDFIIMARTDAISEGVKSALSRAKAYVAAGADMIFVEAVLQLDDYALFAKTLNVPILANITELGKTPLYTVSELASADVAMALYPLSAMRAMNQAAWNVFTAIKKQGTQASQLPQMQTRKELYDFLGYKP